MNFWDLKPVQSGSRERTPATHAAAGRATKVNAPRRRGLARLALAVIALGLGALLQTARAGEAPAGIGEFAAAQYIDIATQGAAARELIRRDLDSALHHRNRESALSLVAATRWQAELALTASQAAAAGGTANTSGPRDRT